MYASYKYEMCLCPCLCTTTLTSTEQDIIDCQFVILKYTTPDNTPASFTCISFHHIPSLLSPQPLYSTLSTPLILLLSTFPTALPPFSPHLFLSLSLSPSLLLPSSLPLPFSPHLTSSPLTGGFIIRIFSTAPVVVELVANLYHVSKMGDWKKTSEVDRHYITHSFFFCLFHLLGCLYVP